MKRKLCLIIMLIAVLFIGCSEEEKGINNAAYVEGLNEIIGTYESFMSEDMYVTYFHMIDLYRFNRDYNNERIKQNLEDVVIRIEDMEQALEALALEKKEGLVLEYQAEMEFALNEIKSIYKEAADYRALTQIAPSQFSLYSKMFTMMDDLKEPIGKYNTNLLLLSEALSETPLDQEVMSIHLENRLRFDYFYTIFASQVAGYQEHTGLPVHPTRIEYLVDNKVFYRVSELNLDILGRVEQYLAAELTVFDDQGIEALYPSQINELEYAVDNINQYFSIRSQLPADFFTSGDYKNYQTEQVNDFDSRYFFMISMQIDIYVDNKIGCFNYDFEAYPEQQFDKMDEAFNNIRLLLFNHEARKDLALYSELELEPMTIFGKTYY